MSPHPSPRASAYLNPRGGYGYAPPSGGVQYGGAKYAPPPVDQGYHTDELVDFAPISMPAAPIGPGVADDSGMSPDRRPGGYRPVVDPVRPHTRPAFNPNAPADAYGDMSPDRPRGPRRSDTSGFGPPPPRPSQSFQPPRVQPSRAQAYGSGPRPSFKTFY